MDTYQQGTFRVGLDPLDPLVPIGVRKLVAQFAAITPDALRASREAKRKKPKEPETYKGIDRSSPKFHNEFFTRFLIFGKASPIPIDHALWQEFSAWLHPDHPAQNRIAKLRKSRRVDLEEFRRRCADYRAALSRPHPLTRTSQPPYAKLSRWVRERLSEKAVVRLLAKWELPQDALTVDILEWYILTDELPIE